jgi:four helix bundle protein
MPTYHRFEELPVWQTAAELYGGIGEFLKTEPSGMSRSFRDQLERASLSVSNNIAEGFERGTTSDLLKFIYIARGSAAEVRSMLSLLAGQAIPSVEKSSIPALLTLAESCSRQLRAWADSLQSSPIKGQRYLPPKSQSQICAASQHLKSQISNLKSSTPNLKSTS